MFESRLGELAALGTAFCWTITALSFESAGRRVGSLAVNLLRLLVGFGGIAIWNAVARGQPLPAGFPLDAWRDAFLSCWDQGRTEAVKVLFEHGS